MMTPFDFHRLLMLCFGTMLLCNSALANPGGDGGIEIWVDGPAGLWRDSLHGRSGTNVTPQRIACRMEIYELLLYHSIICRYYVHFRIFCTG